ASKQRNSAKRRAPRAEVLRREVGTHRVAQVIVDLVRRYRMTLAVVIHVLKQLLAGKLLASFYEAHQPPVVDGGLLRRAALAAKLQHQTSVSDEARVPVAQRRQTVARV